MNQIQIQYKQSKTLDKASIIAGSKRIRRSEANRNIWLVGSGNPKTPTRFYCVMWHQELDEFICDCPAFTFDMTVPCCHIYAVAIYEGSNA